MKKLFLTLVVLFAITGCKKNNNNQTTTTNPPIQPTTYNGFLQAETHVNWSAGSPSVTTFFSSASFSGTASSSAFLSPINSGTISVNGISLKFQGGANYYMDTTNTLNLATQRNFQLNSNSTLPSFAYNNTDTFPNYPNANGYLMNDTLFKNQTLVLSLSSTSNYNEATCIINEIGNPLNSVSKTVPFGTSQISFSSSNLNIFPVNSSVFCILILKKYNTQAFSSKNFRFENDTYNNFNMIVQ